MPNRTVKLILLTGATRGLGRAMAEKFIELGHTVVGCGRSSDAVRQLNDKYQPRHRFDVVDVSDDHAVRQWSREVLAEFGAPDLLLNNAAIVNRNAALWDVPSEEFAAVIDVNIKGVANVVRHFIPAMIERGSGVVVNFSSGWGRSTAPEVAPYCATKWAIEGLTQALAQDLPDGLAAIPLNPGIIDTDMLRSCFGKGASRFPDPQRWSQVAVPFLLTLNASHNGQPLDVPV